MNTQRYKLTSEQKVLQEVDLGDVYFDDFINFFHVSKSTPNTSKMQLFLREVKQKHGDIRQKFHNNTFNTTENRLEIYQDACVSGIESFLLVSLPKTFFAKGIKNISNKSIARFFCKALFPSLVMQPCDEKNVTVEIRNGLKLLVRQAFSSSAAPSLAAQLPYIGPDQIVKQNPDRVRLRDVLMFFKLANEEGHKPVDVFKQIFLSKGRCFTIDSFGTLCDLILRSNYPEMPKLFDAWKPPNFRNDIKKLFKTTLVLNACALYLYNPILHPLTVTLGAPFFPMSAKSTGRNKDFTSDSATASVRDSLTHRLDSSWFACQDKLDGHRILLHVNKAWGVSEGGSRRRLHEFKLFSRNGIDFTETYRDQFYSDVVEGNEALFDSLDGCIIDGELMGVHIMTGHFTVISSIVSIGKKSTAERVFPLRNYAIPESEPQSYAVEECALAFYMFDLVYAKDVITAKPWHHRYAMLQSLFKTHARSYPSRKGISDSTSTSTSTASALILPPSPFAHEQAYLSSPGFHLCNTYLFCGANHQHTQADLSILSQLKLPCLHLNNHSTSLQHCGEGCYTVEASLKNLTDLLSSSHQSYSVLNPLINQLNYSQVTSSSHLFSALNNALTRGFEGLMFKNIKSKYDTGSSMNWLKLKPEVFGFQVDIDVVVIGGNVTKHKNRDDVGKLVLGVVSRDSHGNTVYKSLVNVSGLSDENVKKYSEMAELTPIQNQVKNYYTASRQHRPGVDSPYQRMLDEIYPIVGLPEEGMTHYARNLNVVFTIYGSELTSAETRNTIERRDKASSIDVSIRFPRIKTHRPDKQGYQCDSESDLLAKLGHKQYSNLRTDPVINLIHHYVYKGGSGVVYSDKDRSVVTRGVDVGVGVGVSESEVGEGLIDYGYVDMNDDFEDEEYAFQARALRDKKDNQSSMGGKSSMKSIQELNEAFASTYKVKDVQVWKQTDLAQSSQVGDSIEFVTHTIPSRVFQSPSRNTDVGVGDVEGVNLDDAIVLYSQSVPAELPVQPLLFNEKRDADGHIYLESLPNPQLDDTSVIDHNSLGSLIDYVSQRPSQLLTDSLDNSENAGLKCQLIYNNCLLSRQEFAPPKYSNQEDYAQENLDSDDEVDELDESVVDDFEPDNFTSDPVIEPDTAKLSEGLSQEYNSFSSFDPDTGQSGLKRNDVIPVTGNVMFDEHVQYRRISSLRDTDGKVTDTPFEIDLNDSTQIYDSTLPQPFPHTLKVNQTSKVDDVSVDLEDEMNDAYDMGSHTQSHRPSSFSKPLTQSSSSLSLTSQSSSDPQLSVSVASEESSHGKDVHEDAFGDNSIQDNSMQNDDYFDWDDGNGDDDGDGDGEKESFGDSFDNSFNLTGMPGLGPTAESNTSSAPISSFNNDDMPSLDSASSLSLSLTQYTQHTQSQHPNRSSSPLSQLDSASSRQSSLSRSTGGASSDDRVQLSVDSQQSSQQSKQKARSRDVPPTVKSEVLDQDIYSQFSSQAPMSQLAPSNTECVRLEREEGDRDGGEQDLFSDDEVDIHPPSHGEGDVEEGEEGEGVPEVLSEAAQRDREAVRRKRLALLSVVHEKSKKTDSSKKPISATEQVRLDVRDGRQHIRSLIKQEKANDKVKREKGKLVKTERGQKRKKMKRSEDSEGDGGSEAEDDELDGLDDIDDEDVHETYIQTQQDHLHTSLTTTTTTTTSTSTSSLRHDPQVSELHSPRPTLAFDILHGRVKVSAGHLPTLNYSWVGRPIKNVSELHPLINKNPMRPLALQLNIPSHLVVPFKLVKLLISRGIHPSALRGATSKQIRLLLKMFFIEHAGDNVDDLPEPDMAVMEVDLADVNQLNTSVQDDKSVVSTSMISLFSQASPDSVSRSGRESVSESHSSRDRASTSYSVVDKREDNDLDDSRSTNSSHSSLFSDESSQRSIKTQTNVKKEDVSDDKTEKHESEIDLDNESLDNESNQADSELLNMSDDLSLFSCDDADEVDGFDNVSVYTVDSKSDVKSTVTETSFTSLVSHGVLPRPKDQPLPNNDCDSIYPQSVDLASQMSQNTLYTDITSPETKGKTEDMTDRHRQDLDDDKSLHSLSSSTVSNPTVLVVKQQSNDERNNVQNNSHIIEEKKPISSLNQSTDTVMPVPISTSVSHRKSPLVVSPSVLLDQICDSLHEKYRTVKIDPVPPFFFHHHRHQHRHQRLSTLNHVFNGLVFEVGPGDHSVYLPRCVKYHPLTAAQLKARMAIHTAPEANVLLPRSPSLHDSSNMDDDSDDEATVRLPLLEVNRRVCQPRASLYDIYGGCPNDIYNTVPAGDFSESGERGVWVKLKREEVETLLRDYGGTVVQSATRATEMKTVFIHGGGSTELVRLATSRGHRIISPQWLVESVCRDTITTDQHAVVTALSLLNSFITKPPATLPLFEMNERRVAQMTKQWYRRLMGVCMFIVDQDKRVAKEVFRRVVRYSAILIHRPCLLSLLGSSLAWRLMSVPHHHVVSQTIELHIVKYPEIVVDSALQSDNRGKDRQQLMSFVFTNTNTSGSGNLRNGHSVSLSEMVVRYGEEMCSSLSTHPLMKLLSTANYLPPSSPCLDQIVHFFFPSIVEPKYRSWSLQANSSVSLPPSLQHTRLHLTTQQFYSTHIHGASLVNLWTLLHQPRYPALVLNATERVGGIGPRAEPSLNLLAIVTLLHYLFNSSAYYVACGITAAHRRQSHVDQFALPPDSSETLDTDSMSDLLDDESRDESSQNTRSSSDSSDVFYSDDVDRLDILTDLTPLAQPGLPRHLHYSDILSQKPSLSSISCFYVAADETLSRINDSLLSHENPLLHNHANAVKLRGSLSSPEPLDSSDNDPASFTPIFDTLTRPKLVSLLSSLLPTEWSSSSWLAVLRRHSQGSLSSDQTDSLVDSHLLSRFVSIFNTQLLILIADALSLNGAFSHTHLALFLREMCDAVNTLTLIMGGAMSSASSHNYTYNSNESSAVYSEWEDIQVDCQNQDESKNAENIPVKTSIPSHIHSPHNHYDILTSSLSPRSSSASNRSSPTFTCTACLLTAHHTLQHVHLLHSIYHCLVYVAGNTHNPVVINTVRQPAARQIGLAVLQKAHKAVVYSKENRNHTFGGVLVARESGGLGVGDDGEEREKTVLNLALHSVNLDAVSPPNQTVSLSGDSTQDARDVQDVQEPEGESVNIEPVSSPSLSSSGSQNGVVGVVPFPEANNAANRGDDRNDQNTRVSPHEQLIGDLSHWSSVIKSLNESDSTPFSKSLLSHQLTLPSTSLLSADPSALNTDSVLASLNSHFFPPNAPSHVHLLTLLSHSHFLLSHPSLHPTHMPCYLGEHSPRCLCRVNLVQHIATLGSNCYHALISISTHGASAGSILSLHTKYQYARNNRDAGLWRWMSERTEENSLLVDRATSLTPSLSDSISSLFDSLSPSSRVIPHVSFSHLHYLATIAYTHTTLINSLITKRVPATLANTVNTMKMETHIHTLDLLSETDGSHVACHVNCAPSVWIQTRPIDNPQQRRITETSKRMLHRCVELERGIDRMRLLGRYETVRLYEVNLANMRKTYNSWLSIVCVNPNEDRVLMSKLIAIVERQQKIKQASRHRPSSSETTETTLTQTSTSTNVSSSSSSSVTSTSSVLSSVDPLGLPWFIFLLTNSLLPLSSTQSSIASPYTLFTCPSHGRIPAQHTQPLSFSSPLLSDARHLRLSAPLAPHSHTNTNLAHPHVSFGQLMAVMVRRGHSIMSTAFSLTSTQEALLWVDSVGNARNGKFVVENDCFGSFLYNGLHNVLRNWSFRLSETSTPGIRGMMGRYGRLQTCISVQKLMKPYLVSEDDLENDNQSISTSSSSIVKSPQTVRRRLSSSSTGTSTSDHTTSTLSSTQSYIKYTQPTHWSKRRDVLVCNCSLCEYAMLVRQIPVKCVLNIYREAYTDSSQPITPSPTVKPNDSIYSGYWYLDSVALTSNLDPDQLLPSQTAVPITMPVDLGEDRRIFDLPEPSTTTTTTSNSLSNSVSCGVSCIVQRHPPLESLSPSAHCEVLRKHTSTALLLARWNFNHWFSLHHPLFVDEVASKIEHAFAVEGGVNGLSEDMLLLLNDLCGGDLRRLCRLYARQHVEQRQLEIIDVFSTHCDVVDLHYIK